MPALVTAWPCWQEQRCDALWAEEGEAGAEGAAAAGGEGQEQEEEERGSSSRRRGAAAGGGGEGAGGRGRGRGGSRGSRRRRRGQHGRTRQRGHISELLDCPQLVEGLLPPKPGGGRGAPALDLWQTRSVSLDQKRPE